MELVEEFEEGSEKFGAEIGKFLVFRLLPVCKNTVIFIWHVASLSGFYV